MKKIAIKEDNIKITFALLATICCIIFYLITLAGCVTNQKESGPNCFLNQFQVLEKTTNGDYDLYITYDKDTKVMYYIINGCCEFNISPIYDSDGEVMIYKEQ